MAFDGKKLYVIAEAGVNHNGDEQLALEMVKVAADAGADAIKFQLFDADKLVTKSAQKAGYQKENDPESGATQYEMLKGLELPLPAYARIKECCEQHGIDFLCTPFDETTSDALAPLVDRFKVGSGDLTTLPFLRHLGGHGKPVILSTGMGNLEEVQQGIEALKAGGAPEIFVLHCTSNYPCEAHEANLRAIETMARETNLPIGYSDHTTDNLASITAVSLGARVLEKHFTLDRNMKGPDHKASLEPGELKGYVEQVRRVLDLLGDGVKRPMPSELETAKIARKSVVWSADKNVGATVTMADLTWKRPGTGIPPAAAEQLVGRSLIRAVKGDELASWEDLAD